MSSETPEQLREKLQGQVVMLNYLIASIFDHYSHGTDIARDIVELKRVAAAVAALAGMGEKA